MGLINELLTRLRCEDVIGQRYGLRAPSGGEIRTEAHDSLVIDTENQKWFWFSQSEGGRPAGGNVLSFLAFERFRRCKLVALTKEERREILKEACALAKIDWNIARKESAKGSAKPSERAKERKKGRWFASALEAQECLAGGLARDGFRLTKVWTYEARTKKGAFEPAIEVLRFEKGAGAERRKELRPLHRVRNGWRIGLGPWGARSSGRLCPLYNLPAICKALDDLKTPLGSLHVVEGEKCADALKALGLLVTTSQGGVGRWAETDWEPIAQWIKRGGRVVFWADQDAWKSACVHCGKSTEFRHYKVLFKACAHCKAEFTSDDQSKMKATENNSGLSYVDSISQFILKLSA